MTWIDVVYMDLGPIKGRKTGRSGMEKHDEDRKGSTNLRRGIKKYACV